jgi:RNA polymerase sigma-70 factor (ECF subfamily)
MSTSNEPTDGELLVRAAEGDEEAFVTLYRRRHGPVYRFALRMTGSSSSAEEVTQEVFLALVRDPSRYDASQGSLAAFLTGIARNVVLRRSERPRQFVSLEGGASDAVPEGLIDRRDPHGELDRNERVARVRRAVMALPEHYREVIVVCDLEELSYVEAADALGCSVGTVRSRLHRARALLVEKLRASEAREREAGGTPAKRCFV